MPALSVGRVSDSSALDFRGGVEDMALTMTTRLARPDIMTGLGTVEAGQAVSLLKLVLDADVMGYVDRFLTGITVDTEHAAVESIAEVGPGGHYLARKETRRGIRGGDHWVPRLLARDPYSDRARGAPGALERAREKVDAILADHAPAALPPAPARSSTASLRSPRRTCRRAESGPNAPVCKRNRDGEHFPAIPDGRPSEGALVKGSRTSRVALVFPYFRTRAPTEMLFPPLGAATLAAQLRRRGVETKVFDCTFGNHQQVRNDLVSYEPEIVGVYSMVSLTRNALWVADMVRRSLPDSLLVAGGPLPTVFPGRYSERFDAVFRGEADLSFPRFCEDFVAGRATAATMGDLPLDSYCGLYISNHGLHVVNATVHHGEKEIASFPLPDRSDFDHTAYQNVWLDKTGSKTTSIIVTLGCPYGCEFCSKPIFGNVVRHRDLDAVFAEIEIISDLGYDSLWIADDTFTLSRSYLEEFCRRITGRGIGWSCLSRANGIEAGTVRLMKSAGCRRVHLGLESGSQATLDLMKKRITVEGSMRTAELYRDAGIEVAAFFIVGYPGENVSSIEETFRFALSLPLDDISFNVPMPLPGSELFVRLGAPDEGKDWTRENEVTFVFPSEIDETWLRRRIEETTAAFARKKRVRRPLPVPTPTVERRHLSVARMR
jgi:anaerobic magnesium-protoporphyrin IX monomethyl ester cyclase